MLRVRYFLCSLLGLGMFSLVEAQDNPHVARLSSSEAQFTSTAIQSECKQIVAGFNTGQMVVMDPLKKNFSTMNAWGAHAKTVSVVIFSKDEKQIITAGIDGHIKFWDVALGMKYQTDTEARRNDPKIAAPEIPTATRTLRTAHSGGVRALAVSPDGKYLASCGAEGNIKIWTSESDKPLFTYPAAHKSGANALAFSPDGKILASGGGDKLVKFWSIEADATPKRTLEHESPVTSLNYKPDGKQLVTGSGTAKKSGEVRIWDTMTGEELFSLPGHTDTVTSVMFHPKEPRLVSAGKDKTMRVWNLETKQEGYREEYNQPFIWVGFSQDTRLLVGLNSRDNTWWRGTQEWPKKK